MNKVMQFFSLTIVNKSTLVFLPSLKQSVHMCDIGGSNIQSILVTLPQYSYIRNNCGLPCGKD